LLPHITKRTDFIAVAQKGRRWVTPSHIVQVLCEKAENKEMRYGITASRKVGKAVKRNYAKRRLRALVEELLPQYGLKGCDYVFIAKPSLVTTSFKALHEHMQRGLEKLNEQSR